MRWETAPRYLIASDGVVAESWSEDLRIRSMGIRESTHAPRSPWQNGFVSDSSVRSTECLDHVLCRGARGISVNIRCRTRNITPRFRTHYSWRRRATPVSRAGAARNRAHSLRPSSRRAAPQYIDLIYGRARVRRCHRGCRGYD